MNRGEIYIAELGNSIGSEQQGKGPVIILSHDGFNQTPGWRSIIVVPLSTSSKQAKRGPTAIKIRKGIGGLEKESIALCHQLTTIDKVRLTKRIGILPQNILSQVEEGIKIAINLE